MDASGRLFNIDSAPEGINIGGIISSLKDKILSEGYNHAVVQVANKYFYGSFAVPFAIGFSTHKFMLYGGTLVFSKYPMMKENPLMDAHTEWETTYSGFGTRLHKDQ